MCTQPASGTLITASASMASCCYVFILLYFEKRWKGLILKISSYSLQKIDSAFYVHMQNQSMLQTAHKTKESPFSECEKHDQFSWSSNDAWKALYFFPGQINPETSAHLSHVSNEVQRCREKHSVSILSMHSWYSKGNSINCRNYGQTIGVNRSAISWQHSADTANGKSSQLWQESRYKYILHTKRCVPHSEHRFSAPSSELCQI